MSDLNVNKINVNNEVKAQAAKEAAPEAEVNSVFNKEVGAKPDDKIGNELVRKVAGQIGGKEILIRKDTKGFLTNSISGKYDNQSIKVEEKSKIFSSKKTFNGAIGKDKVVMESKSKSFFGSGVVYEGSYRGKKFQLDYKPIAIDKSELKGKYGKENVNIVRDGKISKKDAVAAKNLPKDFAPMSALILGIEEIKNIEKAKLAEDGRVIAENMACGLLTDNSIGRNQFGELAGQINGKEFAMRKHRGTFDTMQIEGEYDSEPIDVEEYREAISTDRFFNGTIGRDRLDMRSEQDLFNDDMVYEGSYKGKKFQFDYTIGLLGNANLKGKYGKANVDVDINLEILSSQGINSNSLPSDIAPVAALIIGIQKAKED